MYKHVMIPFPNALLPNVVAPEVVYVFTMFFDANRHLRLAGGSPALSTTWQMIAGNVYACVSTRRTPIVMIGQCPSLPEAQHPHCSCSAKSLQHSALLVFDSLA